MAMLPFLVIIVGLIAWSVVKAASNRAARRDFEALPQYSELAVVVSKRTEVSGGGQDVVHQVHYVTFELPSGQRRELRVSPAGYGMLVEGDQGQVIFKGDLVLDFQRQVLR